MELEDKGLSFKREMDPSVNLRENAMAILEHGQPELYFDFMDAMSFVPDPVLMRDLAVQDGKEHKDSWGTTFIFPPDEPGEFPHVTPENAVVKDITTWDEQLVVPSTEGLDWTAAKTFAKNVDRDREFVGFFSAGGLFERSHHLMGMEEAFIAYLEEPEAMEAMLRAIADYKIAQIKETARQVHPDVIFFQDDWGSKQSLFLPPETWREMIKPLQIEIAETIHDCGMLYVHHADCICEPIVEDMVEIGVDIWQGVIPQNDIVGIQRRTGGKLAMIGGIDGPKLDVADISEEEIRRSVDEAIDTYCAAGRFFPGIPNGQCYREWNDVIVKDELAKHGRQYAIDHPVG